MALTVRGKKVSPKTPKSGLLDSTAREIPFSSCFSPNALETSIFAGCESPVAPQHKMPNIVVKNTRLFGELIPFEIRQTILFMISVFG